MIKLKKLLQEKKYVFDKRNLHHILINAKAFKEFNKEVKTKKAYISTKEDKLKSVKGYEPKNQEETN